MTFRSVYHIDNTLKVLLFCLIFLMEIKIEMMKSIMILKEFFIVINQNCARAEFLRATDEAYESSVDNILKYRMRAHQLVIHCNSEFTTKHAQASDVFRVFCQRRSEGKSMGQSIQLCP